VLKNIQHISESDRDGVESMMNYN